MEIDSPVQFYLWPIDCSGLILQYHLVMLDSKFQMLNSNIFPATVIFVAPKATFRCSGRISQQNSILNSSLQGLNAIFSSERGTAVFIWYILLIFQIISSYFQRLNGKGGFPTPPAYVLGFPFLYFFIQYSLSEIAQFPLLLMITNRNNVSFQTIRRTLTFRYRHITLHLSDYLL